MEILQKILTFIRWDAIEIHFGAFGYAGKRGHIQRNEYHIAADFGDVAPRHKDVLARFEQLFDAGHNNSQHIFAVAVYDHVHQLAHFGAVLQVYHLFRS